MSKVYLYIAAFSVIYYILLRNKPSAPRSENREVKKGVLFTILVPIGFFILNMWMGSSSSSWRYMMSTTIWPFIMAHPICLIVAAALAKRHGIVKGAIIAIGVQLLLVAVGYTILIITCAGVMRR